MRIFLDLVIIALVAYYIFVTNQPRRLECKVVGEYQVCESFNNLGKDK